MNLNRIELRKIQYDFNSWSNRLLQANFQDYIDILKKYIAFLENTQIIYDFILDCGCPTFDVEKEVQEVKSSYGSFIFSLGDTTEEEIRNVYAILKYIVEKKIEIHYSIAIGYSSSNKYQDRIKGFNDRFVMVLIRHIETFLTKVGIGMGIDEKTTYNVIVENGQAIFAGDNATITATNNIGIDADKLNELISKVREYAVDFSDEDIETMNEALETIEEESKSEKPKKSGIKTAIKALKAIKGTTEFAAAIVALAEFFSTII